jgi:hypothetical protein
MDSAALRAFFGCLTFVDICPVLNEGKIIKKAHYQPNSSLEKKYFCGWYFMNIVVSKYLHKSLFCQH